MMGARKAGSEDARYEAVKAVKNSRAVLRIIDQHACQDAALALQAHANTGGQQPRLEQRPRKRLRLVPTMSSRLGVGAWFSWGCHVQV